MRMRNIHWPFLLFSFVDRCETSPFVCSQITDSPLNSLEIPSQSLSSSCQSFAQSSDGSSELFFRNSRVESDSINSRSILMANTQQSSVVQPLLTDLYQISMAYAYWKSEKYQEVATFDLYFRKNR